MLIGLAFGIPLAMFHRPAGSRRTCSQPSVPSDRYRSESWPLCSWELRSSRVGLPARRAGRFKPRECRSAELSHRDSGFGLN